MNNAGDPRGGSLPLPQAKSEAVGIGSTPTPATIPCEHKMVEHRLNPWAGSYENGPWSGLFCCACGIRVRMIS